MSWIRLDDQFTDHPKVVSAGPLAGWLHVCALVYCGRYLTDGFIPHGQVPKMADWTGIALVPPDNSLASAGSNVDWRQLVQRLVGVGLWVAVDGGYQIHDYLEYNPSREEALQIIETRRRVGRIGGLRSQESKTQATAKQNSTPSPSPSKDKAPAPKKAQRPSVEDDDEDPFPETKPPKAVIPPAVVAFQEVMHRYPPKGLWADIETMVGDEIPRWQKTVKAWLALGYKPTDLKHMMECFLRGEIPGDNRNSPTWSKDQ